MTAPLDTAGLVEDLVRAVALRCHSHPGPERRSATERTDSAKKALLDALTAKDSELAEARARVELLEALTATPLWSHRALTAKLFEIIATRFGVRFLDPPDGGDVPIHEQVERMADALLDAESRARTVLSREKEASSNE
ncbi:MAG: hypothetical protein J0I42_15220 [Bosea sp.]|uniref:hypothetical protein n=1 Tax=Bosea sp. (in: a-proteobacteria) TaxID=1871050 RepID=UPI001ACD7A89|nr:hypothetical protein [Bosea sp. (in: a-proteobacteria)]MBN9453298.1 hypothetical protein [Bosea sp. (in: a-proteobacteria)]